MDSFVENSLLPNQQFYNYCDFSSADKRGTLLEQGSFVSIADQSDFNSQIGGYPSNSLQLIAQFDKNFYNGRQLGDPSRQQIVQPSNGNYPGSHSHLQQQQSMQN